MTTYTSEHAAHLEKEFRQTQRGLIEVHGHAIAFSHNRLIHGEAKKYMLQGVARRLGLIRHTASRIFDIFPPGRMERRSHGSYWKMSMSISMRLFFM